MATLLYPEGEFRITHQEMIKGIRRGQTKTNFRSASEVIATSECSIYPIQTISMAVLIVHNFDGRVVQLVDIHVMGLH